MIYEQTPIYIYTSGKYGDGSMGVLQGIFDSYETLRYTVGFYNPGSFEITGNAGALHVDKLKIGRLVKIGDDATKIGIIKGVKTTLREDGALIYSVTGVEAWAIIGQRCIVPPGGSTHFTSASTVPIETGIKNMINGQLASTRAIPGLTVVASSGRGSNMEMSERYSNLLDACTRYLDSAYCGLFVTLGAGLSLDFYTGTNRSASVIFSSETDSVQSATLDKTDMAYRNLAIVGGQGDGAARTIVNVAIGTEPTGIDRMETFVDARDLSVTASLTNRGVQKLQEVSSINFITLDALTYSKYVYGLDYFVGDIVTIRDFGLTQSSRITSVTEERKAGSFKLTLNIDRAKTTIQRQIGNLISATVRQNAIF